MNSHKKTLFMEALSVVLASLKKLARIEFSYGLSISI